VFGSVEMGYQLKERKKKRKKEKKTNIQRKEGSPFLG